MTIKHKELITKIFSFINKILFIEKKNNFKHNKFKLYPTEIHLMSFIHQHGTTNATRMAEQLGVTKGAISQNLSRLEKKGILTKYKDPYNKNELTVEFTEQGKEVIKHFIEQTAELHVQFDSYFSKLNDSEISVIHDFIEHAELIMKKVLEKLH